MEMITYNDHLMADNIGSGCKCTEHTVGFIERWIAKSLWEMSEELDVFELPITFL